MTPVMEKHAMLLSSCFHEIWSAGQFSFWEGQMCSVMAEPFGEITDPVVYDGSELQYAAWSAAAAIFEMFNLIQSLTRDTIVKSLESGRIVHM